MKKNTVIKITTKKDYDAVMRKLKEIGGLHWGIDEIPTSYDGWKYAKNKDDFAIDIEKDYICYSPYSYYRKTHSDFHFTTAKEFLKEGTLEPYHSPTNTELIKFFNKVIKEFEGDIDYWWLCDDARYFLRRLEQESTTTGTFLGATFEATPDITNSIPMPHNVVTTTPKPKKTEKLEVENFQIDDIGKMFGKYRRKINELTDAINEMRGSK